MNKTVVDSKLRPRFALTRDWSCKLMIGANILAL